MNADIEVKSNTARALADDAIVWCENKQYVFTAKGNNQFEMIEVQPGSTENGYTEIKVGEKLADETIAVKGTCALLMKMKNTSEE